MRKIKIVADSSSDLFALDSVHFAAAPLKIITADAEYVDDESLDVEGMVNTLLRYKGKSSTSCPNIDDWLGVFGDADEVYCFTITAELSGSYNAACLAKDEYEAAHPERRVFVMNTLSTGPEMALLIHKTEELTESGADFDTVCKEVTDYSRKTGLLFMLSSMKNLANNGRVNPIVAKAAGLLGIRVVGKASSKGDLEPLGKFRGADGALKGLLDSLIFEGYRGGRLYIAHCFNEGDAATLADMITEKFATAEIKIYRLGGLCSFYAEKGGMLVGFEK